MSDTNGQPRFRVYTLRDLASLPELQHRPGLDLRAMHAVASVLPFRVNDYVVRELIDWSRVPEDPIFQLTFPQPGMLSAGHLAEMVGLLNRGARAHEIEAAARRIRMELNPHPSGQAELNVPLVDGRQVPGVQHKYPETVLFFPSAGQTCHAYCTYCFRWAQFVDTDELRFASNETDLLVQYLRAHPEVRSVLITGGDPMIMKTGVLRRYVEPLLELDQLETIRVGTKAMAWWPYRFTTDNDADDLLRLFEQVVGSGRSLAFMAHYSHPVELEPAAARTAVERIRGTGAVIRSQAPLIGKVNDSVSVWAEMWRQQTRLGVVPYYMFVERDTGAHDYFEVPLSRAFEIFNGAYSSVSGLTRTVRGPSMSATPGKVVVDGVVRVAGEEVFVLRFLQARDPRWVGKPFFAAFDAGATWLDELRPAFGERRFFFEDGLEEMRRARLCEQSAGAARAC